MSQTYIENVLIVNEGKIIKGAVFIDGSFIKHIIIEGSEFTPPLNAHRINGEGNYLIPGVIDDQVHFREPGLTHKADIYTESKAAIAGGITSFMEMPNTIPQTTNLPALEAKFEIAASKSLANYSFYIGATNDNLNSLLAADPKHTAGIKVFMGASTGNMLVDNPETLEGIFKNAKMLIATHCEDEETIKRNLTEHIQEYGENIPVACHPSIRSAEACYKSSSLAIALAKKHGSKLHVLHISSAKETELFDNITKLQDKRITAEVCVHHLFFNQNDYATKGNFIKWNPAIKEEQDRMGLWKALLDDRFDVIATDHAPHTIEEKGNSYQKAPSGAPMVQHALTTMMEMVDKGFFSIEKLVTKMCHNPAILFNINQRGYIREGYYADLVIVGKTKPWQISKSNILYKCGWSPLEGITFNNKVFKTIVNGNLIYNDGECNEKYKGMPLLFNR